MKAVSAVVFMFNPKKLCNTCMAKFLGCLTVGPIQLLISFYYRAPWRICYSFTLPLFPTTSVFSISISVYALSVPITLFTPLILNANLNCQHEIQSANTLSLKKNDKKMDLGGGEVVK